MNSVGLATSKVCTPTSRSNRRIWGQMPLESPDSCQLRTSSPRRTPNLVLEHVRVRCPTRTRSAVTFSLSLMLTCLLPSSTSSLTGRMRRRRHAEGPAYRLPSTCGDCISSHPLTPSSSKIACEEFLASSAAPLRISGKRSCVVATSPDCAGDPQWQISGSR